MLLRSGKLTSLKKVYSKKRRRVVYSDLPFDIQRRIFSKIDLSLLQLKDRALQNHLVVNGLYHDPEAILCWAIGHRDRWLVSKLLESGVKPGEYSKDAALSNDFPLEAVGSTETDLSRQTLLTRHWKRGAFERALQYYRDENFDDLETDVHFGLQEAIKKNDAGLFRVVSIWPHLLRAVASFSCMYGKTEILKRLFDQGLLNQFMHAEYFVGFAIDRGHMDTAKFLLEMGFNLTAYDKRNMHSIFERESPEMLKFVTSEVKIPDMYLQQGVVAAAGSGRLLILQHLVNAGADCRNPHAMYRAAYGGHVKTYNYLRQLIQNNKSTGMDICTHPTKVVSIYKP